MRREGLLMEDVQDGKKTSIQDGVTEDPAIPTFTGLRLLALSYDYGTDLRAKDITSEIRTSTDSEDMTNTVSSIIGTVVT